MRPFMMILVLLTVGLLAPSGILGDDKEIAEQIVKQLKQHQSTGILQKFGLDLQVDKGTVWLKGYVATREQQRLVLDIARRISGVVQVVNDIQIKSSIGQPHLAQPQQVRPPVTSNSALNYSSNPNLYANSPIPRQPSANAQAALTRQTNQQQVMPVPVNAYPQSVMRNPNLPQGTGVAQPTQQIPGNPQPYASVPRSQSMPAKARSEPGTVTTVVPRTVFSSLGKALGSGFKSATGQRTKKKTYKVVKRKPNQTPSAHNAQYPEVSAYAHGVHQAGHQVLANPAMMPMAPNMNQQGPMLAPAMPGQFGPGAAPVSGQSMTPPPAGVVSGVGGVPALLIPFRQAAPPRSQMPVAFAASRGASFNSLSAPGTPGGSGPIPTTPVSTYSPAAGAGTPPRYDQPQLPAYSWPSYAPHPNYGAVNYPRQYSPTAWPYIGPFYPYPQVPLGWRKVTLKWKDGWWFLDFKDRY